MSDIEKFLNMDHKQGVLYTILLIIVIVTLIKLLDFLVSRFGIRTKFSIEEEKQNSDIKRLQEQSKKQSEHDAKVMEAIERLSGQLQDLNQLVNDMQVKSDENETARLKDLIAKSYRYYHEKGEWTEMEKESFDDLVAAYTQYSKNSFVHTICEPESMTWKIIDRK